MVNFRVFGLSFWESGPGFLRLRLLNTTISISIPFTVPTTCRSTITINLGIQVADCR